MTTTKRKCCAKKTKVVVQPTTTEFLNKKIKSAEKKIISKFKKAKKGFDAMDPNKKKEILAGIIGATAVAVGVGASIATKRKSK